MFAYITLQSRNNKWYEYKWNPLKLTKRNRSQLLFWRLIVRNIQIKLIFVARNPLGQLVYLYFFLKAYSFYRQFECIQYRIHFKHTTNNSWYKFISNRSTNHIYNLSNSRYLTNSWNAIIHLCGGPCRQFQFYWIRASLIKQFDFLSRRWLIFFFCVRR